MSTEYEAKYHSVKHLYNKNVLWDQSANDAIGQKWESEKQIFITRLGSIELEVINHYQNYRKEIFFKKPYPKNIRSKISMNAGVGNLSNNGLDKFAQLYIDTMPLVDVLGVWFNEDEYKLANLIKRDGLLVELAGINSFLYNNPYTRYLEGKTVLVVHPFTQSIQMQYAKKELLFKQSGVLPNFELKVLRPPVTFAGEKSEYKDWFVALNTLVEQINKIQFDVLIVGAGAYGLPLGKYFAKTKTIIHLGGVTQIMFGIKGNRWVKEYNYDKILFNENWVFPSTEETPQNASHIENKCYWG